MPMQCQLRPELKQPTQLLIAKTFAAHSAGSGQIALGQFLVLATGLSAQDKQKLAARGPVVLTKTQGNNGDFRNQGPEDLSFETNGITLHVPKLLAGDYISFQNEFQYAFASNATIQGCVTFFFQICNPIERISGTTNRLTIDLPGDSHDQCFVFSDAIA